MLWLKALHLIFVVCWFAGLFYLPRIFVYYAASEDQNTRNQLAIMARRLYRFVSPFMVIAIALGLGAALWNRWEPGEGAGTLGNGFHQGLKRFSQDVERGDQRFLRHFKGPIRDRPYEVVDEGA